MERKIDLDLITTQEEFRALEPEWNALLQDSRADSIFLTWEWISSWWDIFGKDRQLWILLARDSASKRTLGLAPLTMGMTIPIKRLPVTCRELSFLGANTASPDHLDFIVRRGCEELVLPVMAEYLAAHADWDILQLEGFDSNSLMIPHLMKKLPVLGKQIGNEQGAVIHLPETWDAFRSQLNKKLRKNIERYARNLEVDFPGEVRRNCITDEREIIPALLDVFRLSGSVKESQGILYSLRESDLIEFHRKVALKFYEKNWLRLYQISVGGRTVAASYAFIYNAVLSYYQSGYDLAWKQYGVGQQIRAYSIAGAIADGARVFDFLRGEHAYKNEWSTETRTDLYIRAGCSLKGRTLIGLQNLAHHFWRGGADDQD